MILIDTCFTRTSQRRVRLVTCNCFPHEIIVRCSILNPMIFVSTCHSIHTPVDIHPSFSHMKLFVDVTTQPEPPHLFRLYVRDTDTGPSDVLPSVARRGIEDGDAEV